MKHPAFTLVKRPSGDALLHNDAPVWIVEFDAIVGVRPRSWAVYKSVERIPKGRQPWAVDNRRVGEFVQDFAQATAIAIAQAEAR